MIHALRTVALALMSSLVILGIALFFVLGEESSDPFRPEGWALAVVVGAGVVANLVILTIGYQAPAVPTGNPRGTGYAAAYQAATYLRFALAESTAVLAVALAFVVNQGGFGTYLVGGAISLASMATHVYPWSFPIERYRARLERDGGTSYLREDLGLPPRSGGVIQEL